MTDVGKDQNDVALLTTALDHVTRWHEFRTSSGLQVLNFFLLAIAVLSTAYVSAINGHLYAIAAAIAMSVVTCGAYLVGRRLRDDARFPKPRLSRLKIGSQLVKT